MSVAVVWYKRDLRTFDHRALYEAIHSQCSVLPLFILEPELLAQPDSSARHYGFVLEALESLKQDLKIIGLALSVVVDDVETILCDLQARYGDFQLFSHIEVGNMWTYQRDLRVKKWCASHGILWTEYQQNGVIRGLKDRNQWAERWDNFMARPLCKSHIKSSQPAVYYKNTMPQLSDLRLRGNDCKDRLSGHRKAAQNLLKSFLYQRGQLYQKNMSSPITAEKSCSLLSAYLAWGILSTKEVMSKVNARLIALAVDDTYGQKQWKRSLSAFIGRLHWRCHFMQKLEDEPTIEFKNLHSLYDDLRPDAESSEAFEAWKAGKTGYPFFDACMRYLKYHGWINFRMRAMLISVASYHLWLDWGKTGHYLARLFVDYEPGIHWPQVQMQSGTTGINAIRLYNPLKQGYAQDPKGLFIRKWVPELSHVPDAFLHEPWKWPEFSVQGYPERIFDHEKSARFAKEKIWAVRKKEDHKILSHQIVAKHASRKKSHRPITKKSRSKQKNINTNQQFDLFQEGPYGENA